MDAPSTILLDDVHAATDRLLSAAAALTEDDVRRPSRLPGWSVGHVLAHVALNAEAFGHVATELLAGREGVMYPAGQAAREAAIDALAVAAPPELAARMATSAQTFATAWATMPPPGPCRPWEGAPAFASDEVVLRRLREVEVHGVDTGLPGFEPAAWGDAYVAADLPLQLVDLPRRLPDGEAVPALGDRDGRSVLAWLLDRAHPDGLPPLAGWGDRAAWRSPA